VTDSRDPRSDPRESRPSFLLISNDKKTSAIIRRRLSRNKCQVIILDNLDMLDPTLRRHFDIVIIDMSLKTSRTYGAFDLCREIKNIHVDTKVCFLTRFRINKKELFKLVPSAHPDFVISKDELKSDKMLHFFLSN
jgi:DNA-binding NarL/FixJ family response regulator